MTNPKLVIPTQDYLKSYLEACHEFKTAKILFSAHDPDTFEEWKNIIFEKYTNDRLGIHLPEGYVPSSTYWLVEDGEFIGLGNIRHSLTPALEKFGGHIGYAIRPSKWNRGYGTIQLMLLLQEAFSLGIDRALVTCDNDNVASYRVMEKNGGIYQDTVENTIDGQSRQTRRYWLPTKPKQVNQYLRTAHLYDLDERDNLTADIPFYLSYAPKGSELLELACGTGRVSLELAKAGHSVTGLDISEAMLKRFREKLISSDPSISQRISLIQGTMANFALNKKFDLIMAPFRAFQALINDEDIAGCLGCVHKHLTDQGLFIINTFRPYKQLDQSWCYPETIQWERYDAATGCQIVKKHWGDRIDTDRQIIYPHQAYELTDPDGNIERITEDLTLRYWYYDQLKELLLRNHFTIIEEYGWYDKSPIEDGRELIFVCTK